MTRASLTSLKSPLNYVHRVTATPGAVIEEATGFEEAIYAEEITDVEEITGVEEMTVITKYARRYETPNLHTCSVANVVFFGEILCANAHSVHLFNIGTRYVLITPD